MKSLRTPWIATTLLLGLTGMALAQSPAAPATPTDNTRLERTEKMREHHKGRHGARMAELKSKLNLQTAQEPAWARFSQSMQTPARTARPDRASLEKMNTPERLDQMQAMKAEHDTRMQQRSEATKALYAGLNADQKQVFDQETARMMKGHGMLEMRHTGHHGHHGHH